jgi:hypothetical protein
MSMTHLDPAHRIKARNIYNHSLFRNRFVETINFFESSCDNTKDVKLEFFKSLPYILPEFPERLRSLKVNHDSVALP